MSGSAEIGQSGNPKRPAWRRFRWPMRVLAAIGALVLARMWYWGSRVDPREFSAVDLKDGPRIQIIEWPGGRTAVQVSRYSSLSPDELWRVVTDQGRFDEFMPYVRETTVRELPDGKRIELQILDLPHASYDQELEITFSTVGNSRAAAWRQLKGTLNFNEGAWVVESNGAESVVRYQVSASLGGVPQWAVNYLMSSRLDRVLESVERRTQQLKISEPDYFQGSLPGADPESPSA